MTDPRRSDSGGLGHEGMRGLGSDLDPDSDPGLIPLSPYPLIAASESELVVFCTCNGAGVAEGPELMIGDVWGRRHAAATYVYCHCKYGNELKKSHCSPHRNGAKLNVTHCPSVANLRSREATVSNHSTSLSGPGGGS